MNFTHVVLLCLSIMSWNKCEIIRLNKKQKCTNTVCKSLASRAATNCVRTWHHYSYAVYAHPSDKYLKRNNNDADDNDDDNSNKNKPENKEVEWGIRETRVFLCLRKVATNKQLKVDHPLTDKATIPNSTQKYRSKTKNGLDRGISE